MTFICGILLSSAGEHGFSFFYVRDNDLFLLSLTSRKSPTIFLIIKLQTKFIRIRNKRALSLGSYTEKRKYCQDFHLTREICFLKLADEISHSQHNSQYLFGMTKINWISETNRMSKVNKDRHFDSPYTVGFRLCNILD